MYYEMQGPNRRTAPAVVAGLLLFLFGALSIGGISVFNLHFGFDFIPLLIIALWPRRARTFLSVILVFLAGLFTDWGTGGVIGQWALIFTVSWALLRPELSGTPYSPTRLIFAWLAICVLAVVLISVSGRFVFDVFPDLASLGRQIILVTLLFPIAAFWRHWIADRLGENETWGG